jgi:SCY1-like protein 3
MVTKKTHTSFILKDILHVQDSMLVFSCLYAVTEDGGNAGLFSLVTYRKYVVPRLLQMFCVRDAQIRLLLLAHFSSYCSSFTEEQLRTLVLPEVSFHSVDIVLSLRYHVNIQF